MPELTLAPAKSPPDRASQGGSSLHRALAAALASVLEHSALLYVQLTCPTLLTEPVTALSHAAITGPDRSRTVPGPMYVRQLALPPIGRMPVATLVVASRDEQAIDQARALLPLLAMIMDIEIERKDAEQAVQAAVRLANVDSATGLGNRRAWMNTLTVECARAARTGHPLTVIVLDLDGLKSVNDTQGHAAGDQLIALTAACLSKARRATDVICRLGGDEFGIAAPDTDTMQARQLAARIRATLHDGGVTASIGWAVSKTSGKDGPNVEELWRHADELMYQDKRTRR